MFSHINYLGEKEKRECFDLFPLKLPKPIFPKSVINKSIQIYEKKIRKTRGNNASGEKNLVNHEIKYSAHFSFGYLFHSKRLFAKYTPEPEDE